MAKIPATRAALSHFHRDNYIRHNGRRLEHLASLGLDLNNKTVLEPGAGIGDHSLFYLDRGCHVTAMEPRSDNCSILEEHIAQFGPEISKRLRVIQGDTDAMEKLDEDFDVVHCYGLLYHTPDPAKVIRLLAARSHGLIVLETCVSPRGEGINPVEENPSSPTQAFDGRGCRPSRQWVFAELHRALPHVYMPRTQPSHNEFPLDWEKPPKPGRTRAVFIASKTPLHNENLIEGIPARQTSC